MRLEPSSDLPPSPGTTQSLPDEGGRVRLEMLDALSTTTRIAAIISGARRRGQDIPAQLASAFSSHGDIPTHLVLSSGQATETARQLADQCDLVIAVGGDGTVSDVATGLFGSAAALGIVPVGSTNIIARSLGIPGDPTRAIRLLAGPVALRPIDVGHCGTRCFLHMAGVGFDAALFGAARPMLKRTLGWVAYLPAAAAALRISPSLIELDIDGQSLAARSPLVLISNGSTIIAPEFEVYPGIEIDDGWLDVLVFSTVTPSQIAAALGLTGLGRLHESPLVTRYRAQHVHIIADPEMPLQLDGDVRGQTPATFSVTHDGIRIAVPTMQTAGGTFEGQPPR